MREKDAIKLIGIVKNAKRCEKKLIEFGNARDNKTRVLDIKSKEYLLYEEWAKSLSDLIDDIEKAKYLFDQEDCLKLKEYFNRGVTIPEKYDYIVKEINWKKHQNKAGKIVTLRMLLDAFRDKKTHSITCEKEAEYKLFCLVVDEIILLDLFNLCISLINNKTQKLTLEEQELLLKSDSDTIVRFYKIQEIFCSSEYQKLIDNLDDNVYGKCKDTFRKFKNFKITKENIVLDKKDDFK